MPSMQICLSESSSELYNKLIYPNGQKREEKEKVEIRRECEDSIWLTESDSLRCSYTST